MLASCWPRQGSPFAQQNPLLQKVTLLTLLLLLLTLQVSVLHVMIAPGFKNMLLALLLLLLCSSIEY